MQSGGRLLTRHSEVVLKKKKPNFPRGIHRSDLENPVTGISFFCHVCALPPSASYSSQPLKKNPNFCSHANQPSRNFRTTLGLTRTHEQEMHVPPVISGSLMLNSLVVINGGQIPGCSGQTKSPNLSEAPP